ncbi:Acetyl esterase/lipase [Loktanella fryxellensis]|uniref:Acetyl esterase/lipase n=1 Tax=Loktanella fryxellensis TaxID=245187 RepID=A0A1H8CYK5_9RHOB|nr:alpha/beta hydrolase [Loktanella fryxellensis]SEM99504.1 Acetyl esterase/lipase [Loktanella fryxellensis]
MSPMHSLSQHIAILQARLVQKPLLALVRNPVALRRLFTLNAVLAIRTPPGLRQERLSLGPRSATACTMGDGAGHGTLLYLHGGAFVLGNLRGYRHLVARLGQAAGMRAVFLNYRLAPEHPFPAAVEDAEAAWRALSADPANHPLAIAGDSAGGNLALALLHRILANGLTRPCAVAVLCPVTDLRLQNPSLVANRRHDALVSTRWGARSVAAYLNGADPAQPDASPILGTYTNGPPVLIHTDTTEVLHDDARLMADHLTAQGVDVTLTATTGLPHVWHMAVGRTKEADDSVEAVGRFLSQHAAKVPA